MTEREETQEEFEDRKAYHEGESAALKSCPFCGHQAMLNHLKTVSGTRVSIASCPNQKCRANVLLPGDEAVAAWNQRIAESRIEELRTVLREVMAADDAFMTEPCVVTDSVMAVARRRARIALGKKP